jgi:hypothetical protein
MEMWGNLRGWLISVAMATLTLASLFVIETRGRATRADAFGLDPANTAGFSLPPPTLVVPDMTDESDSTPAYRSAIAQCLARREAFDRYTRYRGDEHLPALRPALDLLLSARSSNRAAIFTASPQELLHYRNASPPLEALELIARAALIAAPGESDERRRLIYEAVFSLGYKLFTERINYAELDLGLRLMAESAAGLKRLPARENGSAVQDIERFDEDRLTLARDRIIPLARRIKSLDGPTVAQNAGNIILWTKTAGDRVWRVEAILAAGRLRHFAGQNGRGADRAAAEAALDELARNPDADPVIRAAVQAARELSAQEFLLLK